MAWTHQALCAFRAEPPGHSAASRGLLSYIHICRFIDVSHAPALLRLLGDETRLRLIRVLGLEPLNVSELTAVLGVAQSGVSRHLGLLKDAGLVEEERAGTFTVHRLHPDLQAPGGPHADLWTWLHGELARRTVPDRAGMTIFSAPRSRSPTTSSAPRGTVRVPSST